VTLPGADQLRAALERLRDADGFHRRVGVKPCVSSMMPTTAVSIPLLIVTSAPKRRAFSSLECSVLSRRSVGA
jgi:hypothetical protein